MIISGTVTHNEKYIYDCLNSLKQFCDLIIIVDDGSESGYRLCLRDYALNNPKVSYFEIPKTDREYERRSFLWEKISEHSKEKDFITILDADETIDYQDIPKLKSYLENPDIECLEIILYNMWSKDEYRVDGYWNPRYGVKKRIFRYQKQRPFQPFPFYKELKECGEVPAYVFSLPAVRTDIKLLHLGYILPEDRIKKYNFHKKIDPEGKFHLSSHIESILNPNPVLEKLQPREG